MPLRLIILFIMVLPLQGCIGTLVTNTVDVASDIVILIVKTPYIITKTVVQVFIPEKSSAPAPVMPPSTKEPEKNVKK